MTQLKIIENSKFSKTCKVIWTAEEITHDLRLKDVHNKLYFKYKDKQFLDADKVKRILKEYNDFETTEGILERLGLK